MMALSTSREIPAAQAEIFDAMSRPERLARWWGPDGFTNTFNVCEIRAEGRWSFVMRGPDGSNYPNESVFEVVEPPRKMVIHHVSGPKYRLTITLSPSPAGTLVTWSQAFENPKAASGLEHIIVPANEQNLDRLTAEVLSGS